MIATGGELAELFELEALSELSPRYNISPTQNIAVIKPGASLQSARFEAARMRWGLIPSWGHPDALHRAPLINARIESVSEKPSFKESYLNRRCLVIATGFYEWGRATGKKQPYSISQPDGKPFAMAAIWDRFTSPDGTQIDSCAVLTTEANPTVEPIHHRMPVIISPSHYDAWLSQCPQSSQQALALTDGAPDLVAIAVSTHVNDARHDDPRCLEPAGVQGSLF